jgi:hypothetical protein
MPPEQGQGLCDVVDDRLGFSAHRFSLRTNGGVELVEPGEKVRLPDVTG